MISDDLICEIKKDKFYKAVNGVDIVIGGYSSIFYALVIYFRYKSFIKCTKSQEERDLAYLVFYQVKGNMWRAIILGIIVISLLGAFIVGGVNHSTN
jgi:hypothetical protein